MAYVKKAEMIKTIQSANRKMQRIRKAGYTKSEDYGRAQAEISKTWDENPNRPKHKNLAYKGRTVKDLKSQYRAARQIMKTKEFNVGYIEKLIKSKSVQTLIHEHGLPPTVAGNRALITLLSSDDFKKMKETERYSKGVEAVYEAIRSGKKLGDVQNNITDLMKNHQDAFYFEDILKILKK